MPDIKVDALYEAAVYIDGVSYLGQAAQVTLPRLKAKTQDYKGLGMIGEIELWSGMAKLESKIKWSSFNAGIQLVTSDQITFRRLQVRGNIRQITAAGLAAEIPAIYLLQGFFKDGGDDEFKHQEAVEDTSTMAVHHSELYVAGVQIYLYDAYSNTYIVGGVDKLAQYKANLGLI